MCEKLPKVCYVDDIILQENYEHNKWNGDVRGFQSS